MPQKLLVGIDEAGRGPVIGPMVLCAVGIKNARSCLFDLPLKDSKKLTRKAREILFCPILELATQVLVEVVPPAQIDQESLTKIWLNFVLKSATLLHPRKFYLDAPVPRKALHATTQALCFLLKKQKRSCEVYLTPKADELYPLVSAASIVAKVCRDSLIHHLHTLYDNFGSGYPSDPKTRAYVKAHPDLPIVRKKWKLKM